MTLRKATEIEQARYQKDEPLYPLFGFVEVDEITCPIENLEGTGSIDDPRYEVMIPKGYRIAGDERHSQLEWTLADVKRFASNYTLEPCSDDCPCKEV